MRLLAAALLLAFAAPTAPAADKEQDKAKEAALAFLKAVKAKDLDAVMKAADVPFMLDDQAETIDKADELKGTFKTLLKELKPEQLPGETGAVLDLPAIKKKVGSKKGQEKALATIEKVLGKTGYAVMMLRNGKEDGAVLVRVKDGQMKVVGIVE